MLKRVFFSLFVSLFLQSIPALADGSENSEGEDSTISHCPHHAQTKQNNTQSSWSSWLPSPMLSLTTVAGAAVTGIIYIRTQNLGVSVLTALGLGATVMVCCCTGKTEFRLCPQKTSFVVAGLAALLGVNTFIQSQRQARQLASAAQ